MGLKVAWGLKKDSSLNEKQNKTNNQSFFLTFYIQSESLSLRQQVLETHYGVSLSHEWTRNVLEYCEHREGPS